MSDIRRRLLGSLLTGTGDPEAFIPDDWATQEQISVFKAILRLGVGRPIADYYELLETKASPNDEIARSLMTETAFTPKDFAYLVRELREEQARSEVHKACADIVASLGSGHTVSELNGAVERIARAVRNSHGAEPVEELGDHLDELFVSPKPQVPLGLQCLDRLAVRRGDLAVFAARPGCGKTAMLGTLSLAAAQAGWRVMFFSLEMPAVAIRKRFLSAMSDTRLDRIQSLEATEVLTYLERFRKLPISLSDGRRSMHRGRVTLERIISTTRSLIDKLKPENTVVVVDYLQLVQSSAKYERRHELLGHVCRELKDLALSEDVPVVVAAQLGRGVEQRGKDSRPNLSDLRESGEIENTADQVVLMHREPDKTVLAVAKHRMGPTFVAEAKFDGEHTRFRDFGDWT
jgi:replicative DNA helicase